MRRGGTTDIIQTNQLSEGFADFTAYALTGDPKIREMSGEEVIRSIDEIGYENFGDFLTRYQNMYGYAGIHEGSRFFSYLFYRLAQHIGSEGAWKAFFRLRSRQAFYERTTKAVNVSSPLGRMEVALAAQALGKTNAIVQRFMKEEYPQYAPEFSKILSEMNK